VIISKETDEISLSKQRAESKEGISKGKFKQDYWNSISASVGYPGADLLSLI